MTKDEREQVAVLLHHLYTVRPATVVSILRPCKRRGWNTMAQISDVTLRAIWSQWSHLLPCKPSGL